MWWDSRKDACYDPRRPIGNCERGAVQPLVPALDVYATTGTPAGVFAASTRLTDTTSNPNVEQVGGRTVPFAGDYLWIDSQGGTTFSVWTDWRNSRNGSDPWEAAADDGDSGAGINGPGADVLQCRTRTASGAYTGDTCPRAGGLDQNVYGALAP